MFIEVPSLVEIAREDGGVAVFAGLGEESARSRWGRDFFTERGIAGWPRGDREDVDVLLEPMRGRGVDA